MTRTLLHRVFAFLFIVNLHDCAYCSDLLSLYHDALKYDAQYAAAAASYEAEKEKSPQALAGLLPILSVSANSSWTTQDTTFKVENAETITNRYNDKGWSAQLTQPIFRWQNWSNYKQSQLLVLGSEIQLEKAKQDLILRVATAYFNVLVAKENVITGDVQIDAIAQQLEAAKRGFALGTTTITDSYEAQAKFELQTAQQIANYNDLDAKEKILRSICGDIPFVYRQLRKDIFWSKPTPESESQWAIAAERNNFDVRFGEKTLEVATQEISKRRASHLPSVDVIGAYENTTYSATLSSGVQRPDNEVQASSIGLQIRMPIFSGGLTNSQVREASALREKALDELNDYRRKAILDAQQSYQGVIAGLAQIRAYEAALSSSEAALKANKKGYEHGFRINVDVLNAQSQLFDTRQKLLKSRFDTLYAQLKLKAAAGILQEQDIIEVSKLLE